MKLKAMQHNTSTRYVLRQISTLLFLLLVNISSTFAANTISPEDTGLFTLDKSPQRKANKEVVDLMLKALNDPKFSVRKRSMTQIEKLDHAELAQIIQSAETSNHPEIVVRAKQFEQILIKKYGLPTNRKLKGLSNISFGKDTTGSGEAIKINDGDWQSYANPRSSSFSYTVHLNRRKGKVLDHNHKLHDIIINWGVYGGHYLKDKKIPQSYVSEYSLLYRVGNNKWQIFHASKKAPFQEIDDTVKLIQRPSTDYYTGCYITHISLPKSIEADEIKIIAKSRFHWIKLHEIEVYGVPLKNKDK